MSMGHKRQWMGVMVMAWMGVQAAYAAPAMALGGTPKYPASFTHFDYVNPDAPKGGLLTLPATGGFDTLNPFLLKGDKEAGIATLTLDTLTTNSQDEPFAMYALLAEDMALAADGLSVTFRLNPRARFHNGDAVLARDVVSSFELLTRDPAAAPTYRFYWADVQAARALDARTVRFEFKQKNAELHMILGQLPVFSHKSFPHGLDKTGQVVPIGSGPYRLLRQVPGRLSEFRRDGSYWARDLPSRKGQFNFDTVRFKYFQDDTARIEAFKAGQFDLVNENSARNWARAYQGDALRQKGLRQQLFAHRNSAGLQGFVLNTRRSLLADKALRQALSLSFDFETVNRQMFYGQYRRSDSYFTNSEMAAQGLPTAEELAVLQPLAAHLPAEVFRQPVPLPASIDPTLGVRPNLLRARQILHHAGYRYQDGQLFSPKGQAVVLEYLTYSKTFERVVIKWQRDLAKIGIRLNVRLVDAAVYQKRLQDFDYDLITASYGASQSPGNEQFEMHGCQAAQSPGSRNYAGTCHPAVEAVLKRFEHFNNRAELITAARSLDRVLRHEYYVIPNWYADAWRMAYWDKFQHPDVLPRYYEGTTWALETWWAKP